MKCKIIVETDHIRGEYINIPEEIVYAIDILLTGLIDNNYNICLSSVKKEQEDSERL